MSIDPSHTFYPIQRFTTELMMVILIICVLAVLALRSYLPYLERARMFQVVGGAPYLEMKPDMMLFRAVHGKWPENNASALQYGWADRYGGNSLSYIKEASIENGAIHFQLSKESRGKILTIRPAHPLNNSLGPVVWIVGTQKSPPIWSIQGVDKTNVDDRFIAFFKTPCLAGG